MSVTDRLLPDVEPDARYGVGHVVHSGEPGGDRSGRRIGRPKGLPWQEAMWGGEGRRVWRA
ncbi:MAG TPA: hypothetical protein VLA09_03775, partial [Longimicrobiales bacterium]|nr:hypothetical protein [Longimicrobiales bacterium]